MIIDPKVINTRQSTLLSIIQNSNINAIALNPSATFKYLMGLDFHLSERPIVVFFTKNIAPVLIVPEFEVAKTSQLPYAIQVFPYFEDPNSWENAFTKAISSAGLKSKAVIGLDANAFRFLELQMIKKILPEVEFINARELLSTLRIIKGTEEINFIRSAVTIAQSALQHTIPLIRIGMTELELTAELSFQLKRCGADPILPFSPIIASGPNSANPHATPSDRKIKPKDLLVIDWGASCNGYCSDLTRTFTVAEIKPKYLKIANLVHQANQVGRMIAKPGISADQVDQATHAEIEQAGYGKYFFHRTGHGIGMEEHEEPYIRIGNPLKLKPGMVFTIEPGIYISGDAGVRIEDDIIITAENNETISNFERNLRVVG